MNRERFRTVSLLGPEVLTAETNDRRS
jgi:hypothetical protein